MGYFKRLRGVGDDADIPDLSTIPVPQDTPSSDDLIVGIDSSGAVPTDSAAPSAADLLAINNPDPTSFKTVNGVCVPQTKAASIAAQNLQIQMNRIAKAQAFPPIVTDGQIGPHTIALLNAISTMTPGTVGTFSSCTQISTICNSLTASVQGVADSINAPSASAAAPGTQSQGNAVLIAPSGKVFSAPVVDSTSILDSIGLGNLSTTEQLALAGIALGIGYFLFKGSKKKRSR